MFKTYIHNNKMNKLNIRQKYDFFSNFRNHHQYTITTYIYFKNTFIKNYIKVYGIPT